ncbi:MULTISPECIES: preprotein translocase subunit SecG [unclassified Aureispira]|uniref:preprotein translocase subunit SecG n=1 Tax=unclassified Aureispira TaxID=2649989 RepID=UPI000698B10A|nr:MULTISPECIES: preprotein translocase subunit SecG [unclassified Aureispira]WMX17393.1 preprotein translocase subunit SecG [Aureispira sp. CCB-E]
MSLFLLIAIALIAAVLVFVILIQNPKTGALSATFNADQLIGVARSDKMLEKITLGMATLMFALCLVV